MVSFNNSVTSSKGGDSIVTFKVNQIYGDNCKSWILVSSSSINKENYSLSWAFEELSVPYMITRGSLYFLYILCINIGHLLELHWQISRVGTIISKYILVIKN